MGTVRAHADVGHTAPRLRNVRYASTALRMPAMSPTMTEGGIAGWKQKEGDTFATGDVLLEIVGPSSYS